MDEIGDYSKTYSHAELDARVYAIRDSWASIKGLMSAGPHGYIDDVIRPKQEVGCMCSLQFLYSLRDLPDGMMTAKGKVVQRDARKALSVPEEPRGLVNKLAGWLKRRQ
jgi:hypothetical protein